VAEDYAKLEEVLTEMSGLTGTLFSDAKKAYDEAVRALQEGSKSDSECARRNAARAVFAFIEGVVYRMKQTALEIDRALNRGVFSQAEATLLREEEYGLRDNGKVRIRSARLRTEPNLRFAFDAYARALGSDVTTSLDGENHAVFLRALAVRDRITHPKSTKELIVSLDEAGELLKVAGWFLDAVQAINTDYMENPKLLEGRKVPELIKKPKEVKTEQ